MNVMEIWHVVLLLSKAYYPLERTIIPQGSNLGPLLFLIFINDLPENIVGSKCLLYADDLKLYRMIKSDRDEHLLQSSLNLLALWSSDNDLRLNINKCFIVSFSRKKEIIHHRYSIDGTILNTLTHIKDLGVTFD